MTRYATLCRAAEAVADREKQYGNPADHFAKVAKLWGGAFGWDVTPRQVPLALALLKIAREINVPAQDNMVDLAGYAALAAEVS